MTVAFNFSASSEPSPFAPAVALSGVSLLVESNEGPLRLNAAEALALLASGPHLVCHAAFTADRLALAGDAPRGLIRAAREQRHFDVAELFAFVCPARFAIPTPQGFARSLELEGAGDELATLKSLTHNLLARLAHPAYPNPRETAETATYLARGNWPWAKPVLESLLKAN